jgi:hypothetical protein
MDANTCLQKRPKPIKAGLLISSFVFYIALVAPGPWPPTAASADTSVAGTIGHADAGIFDKRKRIKMKKSYSTSS